MQIIAWDLLTEFAELGHRVTVLTTNIVDRRGDFVSQGVHVVPISAARAERYTNAWWRGSREYVNMHVADNFDAVLSISVAAAGLARLKSDLPGVPFLCQLHGCSWSEAVTKWRSGSPIEWLKSAKNVYWLAKDALIYRSFDELVLVGDVLERQFNQPPTKWLTSHSRKVLVRNGVDTRKFKFDGKARDENRAALGITEAHRVAVFIARLHSQKGGAQAIRAMSVLKKSNPTWKLLMVGGGPEEDHLKDLSRSLDLSDTVIFAGATSRERVPALLSTADVFVFPTLRKEGLPMNVLEALAAGLPCVCSDAMIGVFDSALPISYSNAYDATAFATAVNAIERNTDRQSRLPLDYSLRECAKAYLRIMERTRIASGRHIRLAG